MLQTAVTVLLVSVAVLAALVVTTAWLVLRTARRLRERLRLHRPGPAAGGSLVLPRARTALEARLPGPRGEVAATRTGLHRDVRGALEAVRVGREAGRPVAELHALAVRLQRSAGALDVDLAVVGADPDATRRSALLAELEPRVATVRRACAQLRRGVLLSGAATTGPELPALVAELDDEVLRLDLWAGAAAELRAR